MFDQIVKLSIKNRWLVLIVFLFVGALGLITILSYQLMLFPILRMYKFRLIVKLKDSLNGDGVSGDLSY